MERRKVYAEYEVGTGGPPANVVGDMEWNEYSPYGPRDRAGFLNVIDGDGNKLWFLKTRFIKIMEVD